MITRTRETNRIKWSARWLAILCLLVLVGCGSDQPTAVAKPAPVCDQPMEVSVLSNEIESTFYPSSKWEHW